MHKPYMFSCKLLEILIKTHIHPHTQKKAHSSHSKGSVSVDLFNLPTLPDKRRVATSYLDIPVDFYLPDGKNSKISKIVSRQAFDRQTPDGNEGFVIEIQYLREGFWYKHIFNQ